VWQRVTKTATFCLVEKGVFIHDSMAFLVTNFAKYLLALLNSKIINIFFEAIAHQYGNTGFLCSNQYVEQLPIPKISESDQKPFIDLVDKILEIINPSSSPFIKGGQEGDYLTNPNKQAKVKEYEHQIDQMVYKLYDLTKEEIKTIESQNG